MVQADKRLFTNLSTNPRFDMVVLTKHTNESVLLSYLESHCILHMYGGASVDMYLCGM